MHVLERLGFGAGTTVAVVHADDVGMSHAANVGAFEAMEQGAVTCGSLMVPCPWFTEAAAWATDGRVVDLGVHLTLNAEYDVYRWGPVAGRSAVPSLVDDAGHLFLTSREVVERATVEDVETELRAQIDAALAAGVDVTHLDSHMGTVLHAKFVDVYLGLATEYDLPVFLPRGVNGFEDDERVSAWAADVAARAEGMGQAVFDGYDADSLDFEPGTGEEHNRRRIAGLAPGLNYLICHPAKDGDELSAITDTAHQRDAERRFYGSNAGSAALAESGVETIGMRALRDLQRSAR
jgi:predicted glycoside hydrolase/deacetylase ChbG (UPF0249 family)